MTVAEAEELEAPPEPVAEEKESFDELYERIALGLELGAVCSLLKAELGG